MMKLKSHEDVIVYDRYLFAVPVRGYIIDASTEDKAFQINFYSDNPGGTNVTEHNGKFFHHQQCRRPDGSTFDEEVLPENARKRYERANEILKNLGSILAGAEDRRVDPLYDGKIGYIPFAYHLVPRGGLAKVAAVMRCGERVGRQCDWPDIPVEEHINHAISHLIAYLAKRHDQSHLAHAACRVLMALDLDIDEALPCPVYDPEDAPETPTVPSP